MEQRIRSELIDELLKGYTDPEDITGSDGLLKQLTVIVFSPLSAIRSGYFLYPTDLSASWLWPVLSTCETVARRTE